MRKWIAGLAFATAVIALPAATDAAPGSLLNDGVYRANTAPLADPVQFYVFGGRHWCWYDDAWNGPGWYWCGYPWHVGLGWGGGFGWHGWHGGHAGGGTFRGGGDFHGGGHFSGGASFHGASHGGGHSGGGHGGGHGGHHH